MKLEAVLFLLAALLLSACRGQPPAGSEDAVANAPVSGQPTVSESVAMDESKPQAAGTALEAVLQAGMAYADFRKQVLAQGWTPVPDAQCKANVVGENHDAVCSQDPDLATCKVCDQMTELSACSGDGRCMVRFRHDASGESLEATGYGMIEDWNVSGEDSRLQLSRWSFSKDSSP
ncbi:hypothetical protein [Pseudoxanthomonas wuyuanensis]|nr:hypothetical protein [Pseudoxanthomonas wuyuanensis]